MVTPGGMSHRRRLGGFEMRRWPGGFNRLLEVFPTDLMLALAHAARCRLKSPSLKSGDYMFGAADGVYKNHGYPTSLERRNGARADAAAQYNLTISQRFHKSGVTVMFGGSIARSASVFMTACIDTGVDKFHLPILGFKDEELAAASKVSGNVDSIVRRYSNLHVRFSLADYVAEPDPGSARKRAHA
jgi:hypothetical protein